MSYDDKTLAQEPARPWAGPWDTAAHGAPDPGWPLEKQLHWYSRYSHILLLNASEVCRRKAAAAADREVGGWPATDTTAPAKTAETEPCGQGADVVLWFSRAQVTAWAGHDPSDADLAGLQAGLDGAASYLLDEIADRIADAMAENAP